MRGTRANLLDAQLPPRRLRRPAQIRRSQHPDPVLLHRLHCKPVSRHPLRIELRLIVQFSGPSACYSLFPSPCLKDSTTAVNSSAAFSTRSTPATSAGAEKASALAVSSPTPEEVSRLTA